MSTEVDRKASAGVAKAQAPELRLVDRRAFVGFPPIIFAPGVIISDFALQIPDVSFPFSVTGGALRYQRRKLHFGYLEVLVDAEVISRKLSQVAAKLLDLRDVNLHFRSGYLEGEARLSTAEHTPLTYKIAFDADGDLLAVHVYDVRFYGFSPTCSAQVPVLIAQAIGGLDLLPGVELRGAVGFRSRVLPPLVQFAAVSRGYKVPLLDQARLSSLEVSGKGIKLRFAAGGISAPALPEEDLLLALEGARAFSDAEELIGQGKLAEARSVYLKRGDIHEAHPFAAERLLSLLVADPQAHELALDIASSLSARRRRSAAPLWAEAVIRERRGENARAAERYLALCAHARKQGEETSAFLAAEAASRVARDDAPQLAVKALHELLGVKPDHLPSLAALARACDLALDRAGAIRAYRRIAALARDPAQAADAHVQLARLSAEAEEDVAGARLHCEAALRLAPDLPSALYQLAELCHRSGDHLRGLKALDRLREVAAGQHDMERVGRADLLAGIIWEEGLDQLENALVRFRDAVSILPAEAEPLYRLGCAAEKLGRGQEALAAYQQAIELGGHARDESAKKAAHRSHHALARLFKTRLGDPARAREHLEAALALVPDDLAAIDELVPYFRATGRAAELAEALQRAAAASTDAAQRAALWAEAGELYRGRLGQPEKAEKLLSLALEADPRHRAALEGMLALAENRRDGAQLCRCLKVLADLAGDAPERIRCYRRLAVAAKDLAFDFDLAAESLKQLLKLEPEDLTAVGELCAVERKRGNVPGLASALERRAQIAESRGEARLAAGALRELAQVREARLGQLGEALVALEKAARLAPEASVLLELADLCLRCERPSPARRALEDVLSLLPKSAAGDRVADIHARLGRACEVLGDRDAAVAHYRQAFAVRKLDRDLSRRLEVLYEEAGASDALIDLWATTAEGLAAAGRSEEAAPLLLKCARGLLAVGQSSAAVARLSAALDAAPLGPHAGEVLEAMAAVEEERGRPAEAAKLLSRRAALLERRPAAAMFLKAAALAQGTAAEQQYLLEALARDPSFAPARIRRAALNAKHNPLAAVEDYEAALAVSPADRDAPGEDERLELMRQAAAAALRADCKEVARRWLTSYAAKRPEDLPAQRELVRVLRELGDKETLCGALEQWWPRASGQERLQSCLEYVSIARELSREVSPDALALLLEANPSDAWAARCLLTRLPPAESADESQGEQRHKLLAVLIPASAGNERADLLAQRADLSWRAGQMDDARADLLEAAACADEPSPIIRQLLAWAQQAGDTFAELGAWKLTAPIPSFHAAAAPRLLELARSFAGRNEWTAAKDAYALCLEMAALDAAARCDAFIGLADACGALADAAGEKAALWDASRQGPIDRRVVALLRRAAMLEAEGDLSSAGQSYESALVLAPGHADAREGLKRVLRALEDWAGLAEVIAAEVTQVPRAEAAVLLEQLGTLYLERLGQTGPAEAAYQRSLQLAPDAVSVRRQLAALLAERGEMAEASALLEQLGPSVPAGEAAALLRQLIPLARARGEVELALRLARKAHALVPARGEALRQFAELLYLKGSVSEALPLQRELAEEIDFSDAPDLAEEVLLRLADLAEQAADRPLAEGTLRRLLEHRPLCAAAAERLAALLAGEDPRQSIEVLWSYARQLGPSPRAAGILVSLASRAKAELADVELASQLLRRAVECSPEPLAIHRTLAQLYKDAGRLPEQLHELQSIAALSSRSGDASAAVSALDEAAELALQLGQIDEALAALVRACDASEALSQRELAGAFERRRALILRDHKLELSKAEEALRKSFELSPQLATAKLGRALAQQRSDPGSEAHWLEEEIEVHLSGSERAAAFFELAALYAGPLNSRSQAEAAVREALALDPSHASAEELLARILREDGRLDELAEHYEKLAARATQADRRVALWRSAAQLHDSLGRPESAALALLAARGAAPEDLQLAAEAAEVLHRVGREADAAELDRLLLEADPLSPAVFARHAQFLKRAGAHRALGELMSRRAQRESASASAASYLEAAQAFRAAGAEEEAQVCEERSFAQAPEDERAFEAMLGRAGRDARRASELLLFRARALPDRAVELLWHRAQLLLDAGESLLAAQALDDLLAPAPEHREALSARAELAAASGGASAAQPFDRRFLSVAAADLPAAAQAKIHLRLAQASLASGAVQDAADALEQVVSLDGEGESGRSALSLLSEIYARTENVAGLYRATMAIAKSARADEAEGLYRRAAELFEDSGAAVEALVRLAQLRPMDMAVARRAVEGLKAGGRFAEALDVYQRAADAVGGATGARMLLQAARIAANELADSRLETELRDKAYALDPRIALWSRFQGLMDARQFETALALSDRAADAERARQALWALAQTEGWGASAQRLTAELRQLRAFDRMLELANVLERAGSKDEAAALLEELALGNSDEAIRLPALGKLFELSPGPDAPARAVEQIEHNSPAEWVEAVLERARHIGGPIHANALRRAVAALPARSSTLLRELFELERREMRPESAAEALERLLELEEDLRARAALHVELGELYLGGLARPAEAREAFELALAEQPDCVPAAQRLLELRERAASTPEEQAQVLLDYLDAGQAPAAVSLAERMLEGQPLPAALRKMLAQRLSTSAEGARLAASLWPELLRDEVANPESWRAFAEALQLVGRADAASLAHGFFAGLSGTPAPCPMPGISPMRQSPIGAPVPRPGELLAITGESMPKLHRAMSDALLALGSGVERIYLDPVGGAEAYQLADTELLLGAGALGCFGPAEIAYLCALAIALGERGHGLAYPGPVEGLEEAAIAAFTAVPSSLAACRVLTVLDEQVRGSDPSRMNALEVLSTSGAFRRMVIEALARM